VWCGCGRGRLLDLAWLVIKQKVSFKGWPALAPRIRLTLVCELSCSSTFSSSGIPINQWTLVWINASLGKKNYPLLLTKTPQHGLYELLSSSKWTKLLSSRYINRVYSSPPQPEVLKESKQQSYKFLSILFQWNLLPGPNQAGSILNKSSGFYSDNLA